MKKSKVIELCDVLTRIRSRGEALALLKDILTPAELASVVERWQIVKLLNRGLPQRDISRILKVSIMKVTRGSRAFKKSHGGFKKFLK